jgi:autotransporter translocation and assembly factor TamB
VPRIAIARVAEGLGYKDIGYGDIALATSLSRSSEGFVLEGNGDSRIMNIRGIRLDRINFDFVGTPEGIRVSNGTASLADGTLGYKGNISSNGLLDIGVQSNELQLAPLTALLNSLDSIGISGVASGYTHVNGSIKRPKLAGGMSVYDLTVAKRSFNSLNFKYTWAGNKLGLNQIRVNDPEAVYSGDASVLLPVRDRAAAKLKGDFAVKGQSLSELLSIVSGSPISTALLGERFNGKVNGRIRLSGDTKHPVISVAMGPNGVVQPIPLSARIDLEYRDGRMRVSGIEPFKG